MPPAMPPSKGGCFQPLVDIKRGTTRPPAPISAASFATRGALIISNAGTVTELSPIRWAVTVISVNSSAAAKGAGSFGRQLAQLRGAANHFNLGHHAPILMLKNVTVEDELT